MTDQKDKDKKTDEQRAREHIPSFSKRRHQTDEELIEKYGARSDYCSRCECERPVGHYPHYR